jgi:glycosyltransferase involved in cell wall biosynthesis
MSAYQCGPGMGSVSQIGWEWYSRMTLKAKVTLLTHVRNREALEKAGAPLGDSDIHYIDTEWFAGPVYRVAKMIFPRSEHSVFLVSSVDYFVYDRDCRRWARRQMRAGRQWDAVHAPTPVSTVAPTVLPTMGLTTVLGPLNSGLGSPPGFAEVMRQESGWLYKVRSIGRIYDALIGSTKRASMLLCATQPTVESIPERYRDRCSMMIGNGVDLERFSPNEWPEAPTQLNPLRVLFVGRLIPFKGMPMLFEALESLKDDIPVELRVVGDGPERVNWEEEVTRRGLSGVVTFTGNVDLDRVAEETRWCHVFCLPSVRESGGAVLLEAMASCRPVISLNYGGPGEIVDDGVGALIEPEGPEQVVAGLREALIDVVNYPEKWRTRGLEGRRRVLGKFSWASKVDEGLRRICVAAGVEPPGPASRESQPSTPAGAIEPAAEELHS